MCPTTLHVRFDFNMICFTRYGVIAEKPRISHLPQTFSFIIFTGKKFSRHPHNYNVVRHHHKICKHQLLRCQWAVNAVCQLHRFVTVTLSRKTWWWPAGTGFYSPTLRASSRPTYQRFVNAYIACDGEIVYQEQHMRLFWNLHWKHKTVFDLKVTPAEHTGQFSTCPINKAVSSFRSSLNEYVKGDGRHSKHFSLLKRVFTLLVSWIVEKIFGNATTAMLHD